MHLHHPALSYNGKKKGKVKFASSEAKQKSQQLEQEWKELQKRWGVEAEEKKRTRGLSAPAYVPPNMSTRGAALLSKPSLNTGAGIAARVEDKVYTGTAVVGIVVQHKSCLQPVFSQEAAVDSAKMRR